MVDDAADIRKLLRYQFEFDDRFEVVGEGGNGDEAVRLAETLHPDLIVIDRQMPGLGGVEAIPMIRARSPHTAIVLYTAALDPGIYHAALAAGAIDVIEKAGPDFVDQLVASLLDLSASPEATVEIRVGPVPAAAARAWVANTKTILDAVTAHPDVLGEPIPDDVVDLFESFLKRWEEVAGSTDEFRWAARAAPADVSRIVECWAAIDSMSDEQLAQLSVHWSPPEGEPFFRALTEGVLDALKRHDETRRLAAMLSDQWAAYEASRQAEAARRASPGH